MENIVTLTVNSTHFYLISCPGGFLLFDAGWELGQFAAQLKARRIAWPQIRYVMFSHHHPDHAGLVREVQERSGARLILHAGQIPFLEQLYTFQAKRGPYRRIEIGPGDLVSPTRTQLAACGILGEIVETPGHSPDSISLALDSGLAFVGDLHRPEFVGDKHADEIRVSWEKLLARGVKWIYPGHTPRFALEEI